MCLSKELNQDTEESTTFWVCHALDTPFHIDITHQQSNFKNIMLKEWGNTARS